MLAVSVLPTAAADAAAGDPGYQKPAVGECRQLNLAQAYRASNSTTPIDCAESHTSRVIVVGRLPRKLSWKDSEEVLARAAARICQPAADQALGQNAKVRDRSAYSWLWFVPTRAQRSHGARWIRCDQVLYGGDRVLALPTDETPALSGQALPDSVARCMTSAKLYTTTCARPHAWRATGAFTLRQARYPTERQQQAVTDRRCPALVSSRQWRWTLRGKTTWRLGDHTFVCYTKTQS
jgi:hypothetical protein